jgi:DNA replication and repair protein RecF
MTLIQLHLHCLRNLSTLRLNVHPQLNVILGANGSGKTSILEAIYLLGTGHSFRTREISPLIQNGQSTLSVFGRTTSNETISIQKSLASSTQVKLNQTICSSSSHLAKFLPCQVFYQDIFQIMDAGPAIRRRLLDWGLFHVKHNYLTLWKDYRKVLHHRNALLRQKANYQQVIPWDEQLVALAYDLHALRSDYFILWKAAYTYYLQQLTDTPCEIHYFKGWDKKESKRPLEEILRSQFSSDLQRQHTQSGPHQADILFSSTFNKARHELSRGQQKIILIALKLSQASLLVNPCIYLFDDLAAELDEIHIQRTMESIGKLQGQCFVTALQLSQLGKVKLEKEVIYLADGNVNKNMECFT